MNQQARNKNDEDEDGPSHPHLVTVPLPYQTYESVRQQRITDFYLNEPIGAPAEYANMIHRIRTASAADIIKIHLNTPGGRLDTGIQIINAMKASEALIVASLESKAYSLGTLIFLAADEFDVYDDCMFMIHNYSSVTGGKGNEQKAEMQATEAWFSKIANKYYYPFLSKEEIRKVLDGQDIWLDSDDVKKRLRHMVKIQQAELDAANGVKPPRAGAGRRRSDRTAKGIEGGELPVDATAATPVKKSTRKSPVVASNDVGVAAALATTIART